jgi:enamine deaminase RidA (YjgF/YER057c/UK114 family)
MSTAVKIDVSAADFPLITQSTKAPSSFVALSNITGIDEEKLMNTVIPEVVKTDYWKKIGLTMKEIKSVLKHVGIDFKDLTITTVLKNETHYVDQLHTKKTEKEFINNIAKEEKTYVVVSRDHVWLIHDKKTVDPTWIAPNKQGTRRRLAQVLEIVA